VNARVITWSQAMRSLGDAVIAIGVFDGVHVGHRALLCDTVADAHARGVASVAVTFDRDPDQVVAPETAAPQLLNLADKLLFIAETGVDNVLVIPFTSDVAEMAPEAFLDSVLLKALRPLAVHVGRDFRFGSRATGDAGTLERVGMTRGFQLVGHELITADGLPVTSTRIRRLVAEGDIAAASRLLGRQPRVSGTVRRGRGEGASLGFATANVTPDPYAALPADGVYAGRALLIGGDVWTSAISVGTPPSFPEARDYLEAHLIGYDGDLYDQPITLEFFERLRDQMSFASLADLTAAIAADVDRALESAGFEPGDETATVSAYPEDEVIEWDPNPITAFVDRFLGPTDDVDLNDEMLPDGSPLVADRAALAAAELAAAGLPSSGCGSCSSCAEDEAWVPVLTTVDRSAISAGAHAFLLAAPLDVAGIPYVWDPYAPEDRPSSLPGAGAYEQPFTLLVPASELEAARALIEAPADEGALASESDDRPESDEEPWVDDPELLETAEQSVRLHSARDATPIDWESWIPLLADQPYDRRRLLGFQHTLESLGIPVKWDPFSPAETLLLKRGFFQPNVFTLAVPTDRFEEAQAALEDSLNAEA